MKCIFVLVFLYGVVCEDIKYYERLDKLHPEEECNREGGLCVFAEDCPELTGVSGQCPQQQSQGVECCRGISVRDTRCEKHGGICTPPQGMCRLQYKEATDCLTNEKCCILVI